MKCDICSAVQPKDRVQQCCECNNELHIQIDKLKKENEELRKQTCLNADRVIGTCVERCIVERIKAGENASEVLDDYGIKRS